MIHSLSKQASYAAKLLPVQRYQTAHLKDDSLEGSLEMEDHGMQLFGSNIACIAKWILRYDL